MTVRTAFAAAAATLALSGCATTSVPHPLAGTEWSLIAIDTSGSTTTLTPLLQQRHTVSFGMDGETTLQLDCNRGRSTWTAGQAMSGAGTIAIGPVASTRMACPDPSFGTELARLSEATRFTRTLDERQLVIETPTLRYTFAPVI